MGVQGKNGVRNHNLNECQEIIDVFHRYGHKELDTARMYAEGTTEEVCVWHYFMNGTVTTLGQTVPIPAGSEGF